MPMFQARLPERVDVLLVGMGPVGAVAANLLGRYGISTLVIDKAADMFLAPRAVVLDNEALRILQMAGLEDGAFATQASGELQMHSPVFGLYARADTAGHIDGQPRLVTFYQPELESVLRSRLEQYACVQMALSTELLDFSQDQQGVHATLRRGDGHILAVEAKFLIGADGAGSAVRRLAGLGFEGRSLTQDWLVVDALDVPKPIEHIEFFCDPYRPVTHLAAPGNRQRWQFMLRPGETREQMERPDTIRALLAPWCQADDITIEHTAVHRFQARVVDHFSSGRVFLAGDAAHITPQLAGQGLVSGLRDVANLCWKLSWVIQQNAPLALLDSYDTERRPHARAIIRMALRMGQLVIPRNRLLAGAVHGLMALLQNLPGTRGLFSILRFKPANRFARGAFQPGRGGARLVRGGQLPQGLVRRGPGASCIPSDEALGQKLTLIGFGCDAEAELPSELKAAWRRAGGHIVQLRHRGQPGHGGQSWEDMSDALVPGAAPVGWVAVVRPDRTVLHDGPLKRLDLVVRETLTVLGYPGPAARPVHPAMAA